MGEKRIKLSQMRKYIGKQLQYSVNTYPQPSSFFQIDTTELLRLKDELRANGVEASFTAFMLRAIAIALLEHLRLNSCIDMEKEEIIISDEVNFSIAIADDTGLYVPVLRDAQSKNVVELTNGLQELAQKVRDKKLITDDLKGGTITVQSPGAGRTEFVGSILSMNQCLILGIGRTKKQPVVMDDGSIAVRDMTWISCTMNHFIMDGRPVGLFCDRLCEIAEDPERCLRP
jgi:pyruvate/2-oxoglutarate dehydrogenase complex dihydrolipoamide acyltransferase (E2) component